VASSQTLFLTDQDVGAVADWKAAVDTLRRAYAADINPAGIPPRSMARGAGIWLRGLTAISPLEGHLGCKLIAASIKNRRASYLVALFDQVTTELAALIDGNRITGIRTAATATVAVDAIAPHRALKIAVLGSGFEARAQLTALTHARDVEAASVFSPTAPNRERFADELRKALRVPVKAVPAPEDAVAGADVVICAARARGELPVLRGEWLEPGMSIVSVGSTLPEQREVDAEVIRRAQCIVADVPHEVLHETGDMIAAAAAGIAPAEKVIALTEVIGGRRVARSRPEDIVLYKSVGSALQDVVIAEMLLARARARGIGTPMPVSIAPVDK
jgi:ornithine cyclodeaminase/alanine dehydrogenase